MIDRFHRLLTLYANTYDLLRQVGTVTLDPVSTNEIDASWAPVLDAVYYQVQRSPDGSTWATIGTPAAPAWRDMAGLSAGTQYFYRVRAVDNWGPGPWSATVNATTQGGAIPPSLDFSDANNSMYAPAI